jgi:lysozyme
MDISQRGLDFIKRKEGYFDKAYLCPAGVWTIGWGSIRWDARTPVRQGDICTEDQATRLLLKEIQRVEDAIDATITVPLTQGQFDALCSIFYNIGIGWLTGQGHQQATFVRYLNKGEYEKIPSEFLKFKMANGNPLNGLLTRRKEEVRELWLGDYEVTATVPAVVAETDPQVEPMPQHVEPERGKVKDLVTESWTVKGLLISAGAYITDRALWVYDFTFSVAKDAGPEIMALKTTITPFDPLLKATPWVLSILVLTGIWIAFSRRVTARIEGKEG